MTDQQFSVAKMQPIDGTAEQSCGSRFAKTVIAGAGSIGGFVGGSLAAAGRDVTFLGRPSFIEATSNHGLSLSDSDGLSAQIDAKMVQATDDPATLAGADLVLVTVKSAATAQIAEAIAQHAKSDAIVVSLQNGVQNAEVLRRHLPQHTVLAGMVPFNVVQKSPGHFHRGTGGMLMIEAPDQGVVAALNVPGLRAKAVPDIRGVQWGKLLLNLNNALNALSGLPLRDQLMHREWRGLLATMQEEALMVMKAAAIRPLAATPLPPFMLPSILRLPTPLFQIVAARMLKVDAEARSSMWDDLERRRPTEIDELQGAVVALAAKHDLQAPLCERIRMKIRAAEMHGKGSPFTIPSEIRD